MRTVWLVSAAVALTALLATRTGQCDATIPDDFDRSDPGFAVEEAHSVVEVTEGPRKGWAEHTDTVRFGAYGLRVVQRLDPATGLPAPRQQWGDSFVGVSGKKPAVYMASNWSPWDFLGVSVRLRGETADLPQPTRLGRLAFCGLTEVTDRRVVAQAIWQDAAGGTVRARFVGWRGVDPFGLVLSYEPPEGREVEALRHTLVCQPHDYSDRGLWERRRFVMTPASDRALTGQPLELDPAQAWQLVFHNRFAQNDAGTFLALARETVGELALSGEGNTVCVAVTPAAVHGDVAMVLGDWVDEAYSLAAARFFGEAEAVAVRLEELASLAVAVLPGARPEEEARFDELLGDCPALAQDFGAELQAARERLATTSKDGRSAATVVEWAQARSALARLHDEIRSQWVTRGLWAR